MNPKTTLSPEDLVELRVRVVDVKPSPTHGWFGPHDLIRVEVVDAAGTDLPERLRFQIRRPHDGTADLRSEKRRQKTAAALPEPTPDMTKADLLAIADARGVKVPAKATKKDLLALLAA